MEAVNGSLHEDTEAVRALAKYHFENSQCTQCSLSQYRTNWVFGSGDPNADIVFVGEAPGEQEDLQGIPFVGRAGILLTKILKAAYFEREEVYICNVVKCRPPGNRNPSTEEMQSCRIHLEQQLRTIRPKIICALGRIAIAALVNKSGSIGSLRGRLHRCVIEDVSDTEFPVVVTYHPAALLRNGGLKPAVWEDIKMLRHEYDGKQLV